MPFMQAAAPSYVQPYLDATEQHGAGFESLLWASPHTQRLRFDAIRRAINLSGKSIVDVGCGRADLLEYLHENNIEPDDYIGIELVDVLADAAEAKRLPNCTILRADFVKDPSRMFVGADVVIFSGSLNTLDKREFTATLQRGFAACAESLLINFLASPALAGREYLTWHRISDVIALASRMTPHVQAWTDYLQGDCTLLLTKPTEPKSIAS
jgi:hypothetical protein